jgi:hypothetical protein
MPPRKGPQAKPKIQNTPAEVKEAVDMSKTVATAMEDFYKKHATGGGGCQVDTRSPFGGKRVVLSQENEYGIDVLVASDDSGTSWEAYKFGREGGFFDLSHVKDYNPSSPYRAGEKVFTYRPGDKPPDNGDAAQYTASAKMLLALIAEANRPQER